MMPKEKPPHKPDAADLLEAAIHHPGTSKELGQDLRALYAKHFGPLPAVDPVEESGGGGHRPPPV